nr:NYN domain-containing protein [Corallococcus sp. NCSPR001]
MPPEFFSRPRKAAVTGPVGAGAAPVAAPDVRVRIFVDFWNFQLGINQAIGKKFHLDWKTFGPWITQRAAELTLEAGQQGRMRYEGLHVYLSYNPKKPEDTKLRHWATNVLDRFPGVQVTAMERKPKNPPDCPLCHASVAVCPHCSGSMAGTVEKGVDTAIVTDMIRLAWEKSYDVAVLVSSDRDFIPAVDFLDKKGLKVIHAGFPPKGVDLATSCWASFDLKKAKLPERP